MYGSIYRNIVFPAYHFLKRDGYLAAEKEARLAERLSAEQLVSHNNKKLERLLRFVFENVPYYHNAIMRSGCTQREDITHHLLSSLPTISKKEISRDIESFKSKLLDGNKLYPNSTSGSTGETFRFYKDQKSMAYQSALVERNYRWAGIQRGERQAFLWGAPMDISKVNTLRGRIHSKITRRLLLSSFTMSPSVLECYVSLLNEFKPLLLTSYPGPLEILARYCRDNGHYIDSLRAIITSAEMLYPHQRELIEDTFKVKIYDRYGSREFGTIAQEDEYHNGMRINSDHVVIEILREDGTPCGYGEVGEMVITDLDNYGMPLIRYRIGDRACWPNDHAYRPDMPFPFLQKIEGRTLDVVVASNGNRIGGTYWTILMRSRADIEKFQIHQKSIHHIIIKYQSVNRLSEEQEEFFRREIESKCGSDMQVDFLKVEHIETTKSGKHRIILSELI